MYKLNTNTEEVKTFSENAEDTLQNQDFQVEVVVNDDKPKLSAAERLYERHLINHRIDEVIVHFL